MDSSQANPLKSTAHPSLVEEVTRLAPKAKEGHFDELRGSTPELLPHWKTFFEQLEPSGLSDLNQRTLELNRQVRDNGITYNVYADEYGPQRPWSVDLFPLIISPDSWQEIQSGVLQRARLLENIMKDVYGPQILLQKDEFLDPLELRSDSTLGIPGLMQVIRAGNVILANAPGSAFLESPALLGFLPGISEYLLGEQIELPAMDTWWCGERAALEAAIPNLSYSAIKPTYPNGTGHPNYESALGGELTQAQLDEWVGRITRQPDEHTVQTYIPLAQMPTWLNAFNLNDATLIEPHSYMLRIFALSNGPDSWQVLPGGLARIAGTDSAIASMQRGGSSADVWVQSNHIDANTEHQAQQALQNKELVMRKRMVTSRAAENLYWFGRYTERSENILRLAKLYLENINSEYTPSRSLWTWLEHLCHQYGLVPEGVPSNYDQGDIRHRIFERTLINSLNGSEGITSVGFNLNAMKRTASNVRERLSPEQWSTINYCIENFGQDCHKANTFHDFSSSLAIDALKKASSSLAAITGAQTDRMTRDDGWQLLSIGRHIERLSILTTVLDSAIEMGLLFNPNTDSSGYTALLNIFDSTITFHAQHQQSREIAPLVSLLVLDNENPRSLAWVSKALRARLSKLAGTERNNPDELTRSVTKLQDYDLIKLSCTDDYGNFSELRNCLHAVSQSAWNVSDEISARYFNLIHSNEYSVQI